MQTELNLSNQCIKVNPMRGLTFHDNMTLLLKAAEDLYT